MLMVTLFMEKTFASTRRHFARRTIMLANVQALYAYDGLRGDGFAVRFARLNMLNSDLSLVWVLCWLMEAAFYVGYYHHGPSKILGIVTFCGAYIGVLLSVY